MKNDLAISIIVAVLGVVASYFICNILVGEMNPIKPVSVKTVENSAGIELAEPSPEIFNYKSINPTVEVYVGDDTTCTEYDSDGKCLNAPNQNSSDTSSDDQGNQ